MPKGNKLSANEQRFALEYLSNGENATRAYQTVHPRAKNGTANVEGWRTLVKPRVKAFIDKEREKRFARLRMQSDEALANISTMARGSMGRIVKDGKLLPMHEWPEDVFTCIKSLKRLPGGGVHIQLYDRLKANELMAIAGGELRGKVDVTHQFDYAKFVGDSPPEDDEEPS